MTFPDGLYSYSVQDINNQLSLFTWGNHEDANMVQFNGNDINSTVFVYVHTTLTIYASQRNSVMSVQSQDFLTRVFLWEQISMQNQNPVLNIISLQAILVGTEICTNGYLIPRMVLY